MTAMTPRELVFASIRRALSVAGAEEPRRKAVEDRLRDHPRGVIPQRGQLGTVERIALFVSKVEAVSGTTQRIASIDDLPAAVAQYLRGHNLPLALKRGADPNRAAADGMTFGKMLMDHRAHFGRTLKRPPVEFVTLWDWAETHGILRQSE